MRALLLLSLVLSAIVPGSAWAQEVEPLTPTGRRFIAEESCESSRTKGTSAFEQCVASRQPFEPQLEDALKEHPDVFGPIVWLSNRRIGLDGWDLLVPSADMAFYTRDAPNQPDGQPTAWLRVEARRQQMNGNTPYLSAASLLAVDCAQQTTRMLSLRLFSKNSLQEPTGNALKPTNATSYATPGSPMELFVKRLCKPHP